MAAKAETDYLLKYDEVETEKNAVSHGPLGSSGENIPIDVGELGAKFPDGRAEFPA